MTRQCNDPSSGFIMFSESDWSAGHFSHPQNSFDHQSTTSMIAGQPEFSMYPPLRNNTIQGPSTRPDPNFMVPAAPHYPSVCCLNHNTMHQASKNGLFSLGQNISSTSSPTATFVAQESTQPMAHEDHVSRGNAEEIRTSDTLGRRRRPKQE